MSESYPGGGDEAASVNRPTSEKATPYKQRLERKLEGLVSLKEYALSGNLEVSNELLKKIAKLEHARETNELLGLGGDLDIAISEITAITYPTNIDNINVPSEGGDSEYNKFKEHLIYFGYIGGVSAILWFTASFYIVGSEEVSKYLPFRVLLHSLLAMSLGFLGAVVYSFFFALQIIPRRAFNYNDKYNNYARLLLGLLLGWIVYFVFLQENFVATLRPGSIIDPEKRLLLILPFLVGYSTTLTVGILNKAITAVQITLGLDDVRETRLAEKRRKKSS